MSDSPSPRKMTPPSTERTRRPCRAARYPDQIHADRIRARAARAYLALPERVRTVAQAMGVHHSAVTQRRQGLSGLAPLLLEVDALERAGIDTTPMLEALLEVQTAARTARGVSEDPKRLALEEAEANAAEEVAQMHYLAGIPGAARQWLERLTSLRAVHERVTRVLVREVAL